MKITVLVVVIVLLAGWNICQEWRFSRTSEVSAFQPPLDQYVAPRDTADNGFSRDYGFYQRPFCYFWSDAHTHTYSAEISQAERNRQLDLLHDAMIERDILNCAVFCKTEADLAHVDSVGKNAPVWYPYFNNPDIDKLKRFHRQYGIRAVKLHNSPVLWGESRGEEIEFPARSGNVVPVKIDLMISDEWMAFFAECERLGLPLTWHTNNRYGPSPYNFGGDNSECWDNLTYDNDYVLGLIERILETYPDLKLILCHQGFMGYRKLDGLFQKHPNLYMDTSAGFMLRSGDFLTDTERERVRPFFIRWADRILFGSDANAYWTMPDSVTESGVRRHIYNMVYPHKNFIIALQLPQEGLSKIAHGNFERLFDMEPAGDWWY